MSGTANRERPLGGRPEGNRLLGALPGDEFEGLLPYLETVTLETKEGTIAPDEPIKYVYFPVDCVCSMVAEMEDGQIVEVGTIGNEGMVGLSVFLGRDTIPMANFCQVSGEATRMTADALKAEVRPGSRLHELLGRYTEALFVFAAQTSACNRLHNVEQRASRWLLHTHDRVGKDEFPLTQDFLSQMLGVRRASVSEVAGKLQDAKLITYRRGVIRLLDRPGLESLVCECYRIITKEFDRLPG